MKDVSGQGRGSGVSIEKPSEMNSIVTTALKNIHSELYVRIKKLLLDSVTVERKQGQTH